jgi:arylsulfatase A-like enzyme
VPHGPPIYDRAGQRLTITNLGKDWYRDNLALADRALGELRQSMENSGVWERTAVVITSDHVWLLAHKYVGARDEHVPFLVRLPGNEGVRYAEEISAISAHDVVQALLRGEMRTSAEVARLVERK